MAEVDYPVNRMAVTEEGSQCEEALFLQAENAIRHIKFYQPQSLHSHLFSGLND